jgi:hypothetical protein
MEASYKIAQHDDTIRSYEAFLRKYPKSIYSAEAQKRLEKASFKKAEELFNLRTYRKFISSYPASEQAKSVRETIQSLSEDSIKIATYKIGETTVDQLKADKWPENKVPVAKIITEGRLCIVLEEEFVDSKNSVSNSIYIGFYQLTTDQREALLRLQNSISFFESGGWKTVSAETNILPKVCFKLSFKDNKLKKIDTRHDPF